MTASKKLHLTQKINSLIAKKILPLLIYKIQLFPQKEVKFFLLYFILYPSLLSQSHPHLPLFACALPVSIRERVGSNIKSEVIGKYFSYSVLSLRLFHSQTYIPGSNPPIRFIWLRLFNKKTAKRNAIESDCDPLPNLH